MDNLEKLRLNCLKLDEAKAMADDIERLQASLDPPICRLQFPDGGVPGNIFECAEGWKRRYDKIWLEADRLKAENALFREHCAAMNNTYRHRFDEAIEAALDEFFKAAAWPHKKLRQVGSFCEADDV